MNLQFLDDAVPPPAAGPERFEAVVLEVARRRGRRQGLRVAGVGAALILMVVVAGAWPRTSGVDVASGPPVTIEPTTTLASALPPPATGSPILLTPLPATAQPATAVGGPAASSGANSGSATGDLGPPACTPTQLRLTTAVPAASVEQGAIVRLVLTNVSGAPCTVVTNACADSGFTIETPAGTSVSRSRARSCAGDPTRRALAPSDEWTADDIWSALAPATPGGYVARGFWSVNGSGPLVGTPAPFELK